MAKPDPAPLDTGQFNLHTDIARLKKSREGLVARVEELEEAVAILVTDVTALQSTAADLETRVTSLEGRMGSLESAHAALAGLVESHAVHLTAIYERLANLDAIGLDHENRLDALEAP